MSEPALNGESPVDPVVGVPVPGAEPRAQADPAGADAARARQEPDPLGEAAQSADDERGPAAVDGEAEIVDGFPVLAEVRAVEHASPASLPAVQAAAAAATGFVAGAATVALVKRRAARKQLRSGRGGPRRAVDMLPIAATRSFLVDVHVIAKPGD